MTTQDRQDDGLQQTRDIITAYFDCHGINDARAAGLNIVARIMEAGLTIVPSRDAAEGAPVVRDTNMFSRLADEPPAVIPEGYSAPLDIRTAAEIEHDRRAAKSAPPQPAPDAMRDGTRLPDKYDDGFAAGRKHERDRQIAITLDRDWLGRMVRHAWIEWAKTQDSAKPSWLLPYEELSEADKEADRQIGEYLIEWAKKYVPSALSAPVPPADPRDDCASHRLFSEERMLGGLKEWIRDSSPPAVAAEPVAWADSQGLERPIDAEAMKMLRQNPTTEIYWSRFSIPLYAAPPVAAKPGTQPPYITGAGAFRNGAGAEKRQSPMTISHFDARAQPEKR